MSEPVERAKPENSQEGLKSPAEGEASAVSALFVSERAASVPLESEPSQLPQPVAAPEGVWTGDDAPTIISRSSSAGSGSPQRGGTNVTVRGRRLAHFELEEPIGVGGMAAVIRARDIQLDRMVALKILPPESAADPEQVRRFEQEARAAARLDHDNIARVYYCGEDQGLHFIAFEYVEGENLRDMIARRGRIPVAEATDYILQVAHGLAHAADRGVVHRDIKPSNIIITAQGVAKLVDMGLARTVGPRADDLTHSGVTLGTFDYISPEQALDPRSADTRSDIYSLGCTFYHMLTGRPSAPEGTAARKLRFHQSERPVDPRYYNPEIPRELLLVLGKMLAKEPQQRYQHPRELIADLEVITEQWKRQRGPSGHRDALRRLSPQRRRGQLALVLAVVGLCAVAVVTWLEAQRPNLQNPSSPDYAPLARDSSHDEEQLTLNRPTNDLTTPQTSAPAVLVAKTVSELREAFAQVEKDRQTANIFLEQSEYDLAELADSEDVILRLKSGQAVVEPRGTIMPTLLFDLSTPASPLASRALLSLQGGIVTLRNVRLVMRIGAGMERTALVELAKGELKLEKCEIIVERVAGAGTGKVFHVVGSSQAHPQLSLEQCVVRSEVPLLVVEGPLNGRIEDCGLSIPDKAIVVQGARSTPAEPVAEVKSESDQAESKGPAVPGLTLHHCTWWLTEGAAVELHPGSDLQLRLEHCVLGKIMRGERATSMVVVQENASATAPKLTLGLTECVFYRVAPLVVKKDEQGNTETLLASPRTWRSSNMEITENSCVQIEEQPWTSKNLLADLEQGNYGEAFRLRTDVSELRRRDRQDTMLGARQLVREVLYSALPQPVASWTNPRVQEVELVVDGDGGKPNTFASLSSALNSTAAEGASKIVVTLRVDGLLQVRSLLDIVGKREIIIRAAEGFRPELQFHAERVPESNEVTSLFRVHDGQLVLEQVGFRLNPLEAGNSSWQVAVNVTGSGKCTLRQCHVTFEQKEGGPQLALAALTDPTGTMTSQPGKPGRSGEPPQVVLENCFLRGRGVGVYIAESRPLRLSMQNVLAVLDAPLLRMETSRTEMTTFPAGEITCTLDRVSVCASEPVVHIVAAKENARPVPVRWQAFGSLFVVQRNMEQQPLVQIEGPQTEQELRHWLSWSGQDARPNVCSVRGPALLWRTAGQQAMMSAVAADREKWSDFWGTNSEQIQFVERWHWAGFRPGATPTHQAEPHEFQIPAELLPKGLSEVGADLTQLPLYKSTEPSP